jgi:hypothetical protein
MYNINGIENVFDLLVYTAKAMRESNYCISDLEDYLKDITSNSNYNIVLLSKVKLEECNTTNTANMEFIDDYLVSNRDSYGYYCTDDHQYKNEDYFERYWDDDGRYNDGAKDEEAYEGFSSCNDYYWDSSKL